MCILEFIVNLVYHILSLVINYFKLMILEFYTRNMVVRYKLVVVINGEILLMDVII